MELSDYSHGSRKPPEGMLVTTPPAHQGVADALRSVYAPVNNNLPDEMRRLLDQMR